MKIGMKKGWFFNGLGIRGNFYDTKIYSYEELPPIKIDLDDDFEWLLKQPELKEHIYRYPNMSLSRLIELEAQTNIKFPKAFVNFVKNWEISYRIPKAIGYQFLLPKECIKTIGNYSGFLLRFMAGDYGEEVCLYLDKTGQHFVVQGFSTIAILEDKETSFFYGEKQLDIEKENVYFCATSFNEFIYRIWIEGSICEKNEYLPNWLKQDYTNHYLTLK
jgi:hypothetical protein